MGLRDQSFIGYEMACVLALLSLLVIPFWCCCRQWLEDNTPYNPKESEEWQAAKAQRQLRTWLRNLLLIMMEVC